MVIREMTQISGKMHLLTVHISGLYCTRFLSDQMRYTLSFIQSCQNLHKKFQTWLIFGKNSLNFFFKRFSFFVNWFVPCSSSPFLCENKWQLNCHRKFAIFHSFVLDFISFTEFLILMCKKKKERKKRKEKTTIICIFFSDCIGLFVRWEQRPTCTRGHDHIPDQHSCHHFYHCWGFRYVYVLASFNRMWLQFKLVSG